MLYDFNLRRTLEALHEAKFLTGKALKQYPDISDGALSDAVIEALKDQSAEAGDIRESIHQLEQLRDCRLFRNLVGHFGMKRHPKEKFYVCVSKS